jgi:hypothetical protein
VAAVFPQELAGARIEQADVTGVPLHGDVLAEPAGRRAVVAGVDLDAAIEMDRAVPELVIAKRLQRQRAQARSLFGKHRGDLPLGGAVDAGVGPAGVPAVQVRLGLVQRLEALTLERRGLRMADGRLDLALLESYRLQPMPVIHRGF